MLGNQVLVGKILMNVLNSGEGRIVGPRVMGMILTRLNTKNR